MSSYKNLNKARAKSHRERSQPTSRAHLGPLEKKKDYKLRADDFQKKKNSIKALKRKALDRNPDEFYFNMVKTQKMDGVHNERDNNVPAVTESQEKLMYSQDLRYVTMKRVAERRKIEKLKSSLHLIDGEDRPQNTHTIFVDSEKEKKNFDAAKHFNTHPSLMSRTYNRPTLDMLKKGQVLSTQGQAEIQKIADEKEKRYKELRKRIEREKELGIIADKLETKRHLMDKKSRKKKVQDETKTSAAQYRWCSERKR